MKKMYRVLVVVLLLFGGTQAAAVENVTLFRVFLTDGTAVVSYGEYARVGDRVIFSMPIGAVSAGVDGAPNLHVVNIPAGRVDWTATAKYAESARFAHYIATSAETDYAALTGEVAGVLNSIMFASGPGERLNLAVAARRRLASWPRDHYGYRSDDVKQVVGMLDEVISDLRAAAGETAFALELVADVEPLRPLPMLEAPTGKESIAQAMALVKVSDVAADRVSLLKAIVEAVDDPRNSAPPAWGIATRRSAIAMLGDEVRTDKAYAALTSVALRRATAAAGRADVRAVERALLATDERDAGLGRRRPEVVDALLAQIRAQLDVARRLRLARDQWQERIGGFRAYQKAIAPVLSNLTRAQHDLEDIRKLAGSEPVDLVTLSDRLDEGVRLLNAVSVPTELRQAHALLVSATNLAATAVATRRKAVNAGALDSAWDASSAAAGSMMLFVKAREDMEATVKLPQIR